MHVDEELEAVVFRLHSRPFSPTDGGEPRREAERVDMILDPPWLKLTNSRCSEPAPRLLCPDWTNRPTKPFRLFGSSQSAPVTPDISFTFTRWDDPRLRAVNRAST